MLRDAPYNPFIRLYAKSASSVDIANLDFGEHIAYKLLCDPR